jgi:putative nucleotidyltransferase with HDIG domain
LVAVLLDRGTAAGLNAVLRAEYLGILFFTAVALFSEYRAIDFRVGSASGHPQTSLAFVPFLGSIILFPPIVAVAIVGIVCSVTQLVLRPRGFERAAFNIGQGVISAGLAALFYSAITGGYHGHDIRWIGFLVLAPTFFVSNVLLSSVAISLIQAAPFSVILNRVAGSGGANLILDMLVSPFALLPVMLYSLPGGQGGIILSVLFLEIFRTFYLKNHQLIAANQDLLFVLVKAIETRDPYTSGHSVRVAAMAKAVASDMGIAGTKLKEIERAALLHDIGKIDADYAAVIQKPHDLNVEERALIRTHAVRGADLLRSLSSVHEREVNAVRHHHERFDGAGYPDGLKGDEIPLASRIIMICDSVDAMLSDRPYRKALPVETVREELLRCAGSQFDPAIVQVMLTQRTLERTASDVLTFRPGASGERRVAVS